MDMSRAALPPIQPHISEADRAHPRFAEYKSYRSSCDRLMIDADSFPQWLRGQEQQLLLEKWAAHPQYPTFLSWMRETKAGARPKFGVFPTNFQAWLRGERW